MPACYFHDPVGNIVELIAHRGVDETGTDNPFSAAEIVGFSELGLVGDKPEMAAALQSELGLEQWDGDLAEEARLAFVGEKSQDVHRLSGGPRLATNWATGSSSSV